MVIGVFTTSYPLVPRQLTVVDGLTIGIPGFVLSFQPSHEPARAGFLRRRGSLLRAGGDPHRCGVHGRVAVLRSAVIGADRAAAQSGTTLVLTALGLVALHELMRPLDRLRAGLLVVLVAMAIGAFTIPLVADFFSLQVPAADQAVAIAVGVVAGACGVVLMARNETRIADGAAAFARRFGR